MPFHIRDPETDQVVRELAREMGTTMTEAVRITASNALRRVRQRRKSSDTRPFIDSIRDIQEEIASFPRTGLNADKAFFDALSGDD
jgi:antitoxin VapB